MIPIIPVNTLYCIFTFFFHFTSIGPIAPAHMCVRSRVRLFATLWIVAHQAPLSMGFSRKEYWCGLRFPSSVGPVLPHLSQQIECTCRRLCIGKRAGCKVLSRWRCFHAIGMACTAIPPLGGAVLPRRRVTARPPGPPFLKLAPEPWKDLSVFSSPAWDPTVPSACVSIQTELLVSRLLDQGKPTRQAYVQLS